MANDLQHFTPEFWSARIQALLHNNLVGAAIANTEERSILKHGDIVHRPYHSEIYSSAYTKGTAVTILDVSTTDESLTVDQTRVVPIYIDDIDAIQNDYNTQDALSRRAAYELRDHIDRTILAESSNAGLNNTAISLATSNIVSEFSSAKATLFNNGAEPEGRFAVVDPDTESIIEQYCSATGYNIVDKTIAGGFGFNNYRGQFLGLDLFCSQNLPSAASLGIATNPSENDTVVINGVTFTFNATPSGAGSVNIGADAAGSVTNLTYAINGTGTAGTDYIALSAADRAKLTRRGVTATDNTTAVGIAAAGKLTLSETLTAAADEWSTQTIDCIVGNKGCIDLVIQREPKAEFKDVQDKLGKNILTWDLFGVKTFVEGAQRMYRLITNVS